MCCTRFDGRKFDRASGRVATSHRPLPVLLCSLPDENYAEENENKPDNPKRR
jgi:hypothetical protein